VEGAALTARSCYREWAPPGPLADAVVCTWAGQLGADGSSYTDAVLPDGCIDIVWNGDRLFVAGPDTRPVVVDRPPGGCYVGIRFRPGWATTVLDCRADEIRDRRVDLDAVFDAAAAVRLRDRLAGTEGAQAAAGELARAVTAVGPGAREHDPVIDAVVQWYRRPATRAARLAVDLGVSERTLHRRCVAAVGYGPATLARVLRFRRFLALAERRPDTALSALAVDAGFADQAHLTRETRRLADRTPRQLLALGGVRTVQDALSAEPPYSGHEDSVRRRSQPDHG
jgi:AraC-like DNA-binding protein